MKQTSNYRTVLVIGDNHKELIKKFSADTKGEKYIKYKYSEAANYRKKYLDTLNELCKTNENNINLKEVRNLVSEMDDQEYYDYLTENMEKDPVTYDAYTTENPNAHYRSEKCYEKRLREEGVEGNYSSPFWLNDASRSYSAHYDDICWQRVHCFQPQMDLYGRAWDIVVNNDEPKTEQEKQIKDNMSNRVEYFKNFFDREDYIRYSCSFWCYGIITEDGEYRDIDSAKSADEWISTFFNNFIIDLEGNPLLTIYEVRNL